MSDIRPLRQHRPTQRGITVIEVTMALAILVVMMTLNYNVITGVVRAKAAVDDQREGMFIANSVLTRIARELQLAVKSGSIIQCDTSAPPQQANPPVFLGEQSSGNKGGRADTLTFLAREAGQYMPDGGTHSGLVQITYRVEADPEQKDSKNAGLLLVRDEVPHGKDQKKACGTAIRFPITKNLVSLQFQYFDKRSTEWLSEWTGPKAYTLPSIVQFTLSLQSPEGVVLTYTSAVAIRAGN